MLRRSLHWDVLQERSFPVGSPAREASVTSAYPVRLRNAWGWRTVTISMSRSHGQRQRNTTRRMKNSDMNWKLRARNDAKSGASPTKVGHTIVESRTTTDYIKTNLEIYGSHLNRYLDGLRDGGKSESAIWFHTEQDQVFPDTLPTDIPWWTDG